MAINTTGYSSNQFLGMENYETGVTSIKRTPSDNPEFFFPGSLPPSIYDAPGSKNTNTQIQRGFIRGVFPEIVAGIQAASQENTSTGKKIASKYTSLSSPPLRRCFFQFNPSLILRTVQASTTTLNPLLQNPGQLLQPIPGQASFEFQLLFNREREVSGQEYINPDGSVTKTKPLSQNLANYGQNTGTDALPYSQDQLGDLGVLVDLYVLDSIIGQSITQDSINSIAAYWETTKNLRPSDQTDKDGKPIQPYASENFLKDSAYTKNLEKVLGNSAFLNPMPIRIVFSSLFMVEGFVTTSAVAFHKFSRNMVPTVCQVTLNVQAMYIGFAKKDAYITSQLTEQIKGDIKNDEETVANISECTSLLKKNVYVQISDFFYADESRSLDASDIPTADTNLNAWFKALYDWSKTKNNYKETTHFLTFGLSPTQDSDATWGRYSGKTLELWTEKILKDKSDKSAQDLKIHSIDMYFYDTSKLPTKYKDTLKLLEIAEKYGFDGMYDGLTYQGKSRLSWADTNEKDLDLRIKDLSSLDTDKFVKATFEKPYNNHWYSDEMHQNGLDNAAILNNPSKYFGDEVFVLVRLTLSATSKKGGGGDNVTNYVSKAVGKTLNPNTQGIQDLGSITFGARS